MCRIPILKNLTDLTRRWRSLDLSRQKGPKHALWLAWQRAKQRQIRKRMKTLKKISCKTKSDVCNSSKKREIASGKTQVAQAAQIQQQAFRLQVQQLAALHGVLNAARHAAHPSVQNHNWQMPGVTPGMAQHLGLASQIYSWMAGQAAFGSL
eukprot:g26284.t1